MPAHKSLPKTRYGAPGRVFPARAPQGRLTPKNAPPGLLRDGLTLQPAQRRFVDRHRNALQGARREIFDRTIQNTLAGEPAPEAVAAAVSRAFEAAMAAAPELPRHLFRKETP
jgi:hypothetical protein